MEYPMTDVSSKTQSRARLSLGTSNSAIYKSAVKNLDGRHPGGGVLLDVGCGNGDLWPFVRKRFSRHIGLDAVRYEGLPDGYEFHQVDLDAGRLPLPDGIADAVFAVEIIEHLENPRAFMRELTRLAKPGGWIIVTTPNQLSLLSKMTLLLKNIFNSFQSPSYPAHITALLEIDLLRIANENRLTEVAITYSFQGRMVFSARHYPAILPRLFPRAFSDNVMLIARKPTA